jgi:hypothetical protein
MELRYSLSCLAYSEHGGDIFLRNVVLSANYTAFKSWRSYTSITYLVVRHSKFHFYWCGLLITNDIEQSTWSRKAIINSKHLSFKTSKALCKKDKKNTQLDQCEIWFMILYIVFSTFIILCNSFVTEYMSKTIWTTSDDFLMILNWIWWIVWWWLYFSIMCIDISFLTRLCSPYHKLAILCYKDTWNRTG